MKEENVREWGKIHPLGMLALASQEASTHISPTPENLIYHFTPSLFAPKSNASAESLATAERTLIRLPHVFEPHQVTPTGNERALALNYGHPRIIEYGVDREDLPTSRRTRPLFSILLAAVAVFVVWYIYHVTKQQLKLQTDVTAYSESLAQEQQAKADLVAPQIKVLDFEERERSATTAKLFWKVEEQAGQIFFAHLPETTQQESFQLWFVTKDTQFVRANSFRAVDSKAVVTIKLPPRLSNQVDRIVLSLEPSHEQSFPVGQILLRGRLR